MDTLVIGHNSSTMRQPVTAGRYCLSADLARIPMSFHVDLKKATFNCLFCGLFLTAAAIPMEMYGTQDVRSEASVSDRRKVESSSKKLTGVHSWKYVEPYLTYAHQRKDIQGEVGTIRNRKRKIGGIPEMQDAHIKISNVYRF